jgi:hypothetical protein
MTSTLFLRLIGLMTSVGFGYLVLDYNGPGEELTHPVSGKVRIAGRPLPTGVVRFISTANSIPRGAGAFVTNGEYSVPLEDGLRPGKYLVQISGVGEEARLQALRARGDANHLLEETIPARYNTESQMFVEVSAAGGVLGFDFDLK